MARATRDELFTLFPAQRDGPAQRAFCAARPVLTPAEAHALMAAGAVRVSTTRHQTRVKILTAPRPKRPGTDHPQVPAPRHNFVRFSP